jgi:hypothetical protein
MWISRFSGMSVKYIFAAAVRVVLQLNAAATPLTAALYMCSRRPATAGL